MTKQQNNGLYLQEDSQHGEAIGGFRRLPEGSILDSVPMHKVELVMVTDRNGMKRFHWFSRGCGRH